MRASPQNADGTVDLEHGGHHFHIAMTAASYAKRFDGTDDTTVLVTPVMHCTDTGCTFTAQSVIPLLGDPQAQRIHACYLTAIGVAATLPLAQDEVAKRLVPARAAAALRV